MVVNHLVESEQSWYHETANNSESHLMTLDYT